MATHLPEESNLNELSEQLRLPIRSFRLFAIEKALDMAASSDLLDVLKAALDKENDEECQMMLNHAINSIEVKQRIEADFDSKKNRPNLTTEDVFNKFSDSSPLEQLQLIDSIPPVSLSKITMIDDFLARLLEKARNDMVKAMLVKKFRKVWPLSLAGFLEKSILSKSKGLQIASLETMLRRFPESLQPHIHGLIAFEDPRVRTIAIWCLAIHFPEIAADFIRDCFKKGDKFYKLAALQACTALDFKFTKQSLLNLLYCESDINLLQPACDIILSNPDKEIPFELIRLQLSSSEQKAFFFKKLIVKCLANLRLAKLCQNFEAYRICLKDFYRSQRSSLQSESSTGIPEVQHFNDQISLSDNCLNKDKVSNGEKPSQVSLKILEENDLLFELSRIKLFADSDNIQKISQILSKPDSYSQKIQVAALKKATQLKLPEFSNLAIKFSNSKDELLIATGIEYLGALDENIFFQSLKKHLSSESTLVRLVIVKICSKKAPEYARFITLHQLKSSSPEKRKAGLKMLALMDFNFICEDLIEYLRQEQNPDLRSLTLSICANNPSLETIYHLHKLQKEDYANAKEIERTIDELKQLISKLQIATIKDLNVAIKAKELEEETKKQSYRKNADLIDLKKRMKWQINEISGSILPNAFVLAIFAAIVFFSLCNHVFSTKQHNKKSFRNSPEKSEKKFVSSKIAKADEYQTPEKRFPALVIQPSLNDVPNASLDGNSATIFQKIPVIYLQGQDQETVKSQRKKIESLKKYLLQKKRIER